MSALKQSASSKSTAAKSPAGIETFWERCGCRPCCDGLGSNDSKFASVHAVAPTYLYDEHVERPASEIEPAQGQKQASAQHGMVEREEVQTEEGVKYKGQWMNQHFHGYGLLNRDDGSCYEGDFVEGKAQGRGKYIHPDRSTYEGEWWQDEKSGIGVEVYTDGSQYRGQFFRGVKEGVGSYTSSSGSILFEGQMHSDKMHGEGTYNFGDGRTYTGQWRFGHMSGEGVMSFPDGSKYTGGMKMDARQGEGTFRLPNGQIFQGQWSNGKPNGTCVVVDTDGKAVSGTWRDGKHIATSTTSVVGSPGKKALESVQETNGEAGGNGAAEGAPPATAYKKEAEMGTDMEQN